MADLQFNYSTVEQSKRLMALGVPAKSADLYYLTEDSVTPLIRKGNGVPLYPCWSVGRLIEIMGLCYDFELPSLGAIWIFKTDIEKGIVVEVLISDIERFSSKMHFQMLN